MSERDLGKVELEFASGPDCPHCKAKITPQIVMDEHEPLCAEISGLRASLLTTQSERDQARKERDEAKQLSQSDDEQIASWRNVLKLAPGDGMTQALKDLTSSLAAAEQQVRSLEAALEQARGALKRESGPRRNRCAT